MSWIYPNVTLRRERHFADRVPLCFADRPANPYAAFEQAVHERPQAEALVAGALRWSYAELDAHTRRLAAGFATRGIGHGDRIAMWLGNRLEFVTMLLAAWRLGAIVVPMGSRLQTPEVAYIVQHSGARALVYDADVATRLPQASDVPQLELRVGVGGAAVGRSVDTPFGNTVAHDTAAPDTVAYDDLVCVDDTAPTGSDAHPLHEDEVAAILYTSGTTGRPKGAMLTHLNLVHAMLTYRHAWQMGPSDRTLMAVPASHVTGLTANILLAWASQGTLIVMPEFKAAAFLELAARERMTQTVIVPAMYKLCLLQPDLARHDLSSWRVGGYGGAPMAEATIAALAQALPRLGLHNIYGSTETTGPVTMLPREFAATRPDSTGYALPCAEIVVMNEQGHEVAPGESGELWIRGPMVVPGYWTPTLASLAAPRGGASAASERPGAADGSNDEATRSGFTAGYWKSGDIGAIDAQGFVRVFDRLKDMLNRGGYKVYSVEVENVLLQHPAVVESAIVGKPCPVLGERVHAFVSLKADAAADAATAGALKRHCAERLADYKVPETYTLDHAPLPRNANGKLLKREMRARVVAEIAKG